MTTFACSPDSRYPNGGERTYPRGPLPIKPRFSPVKNSRLASPTSACCATNCPLKSTLHENRRAVTASPAYQRFISRLKLRGHRQSGDGRPWRVAVVPLGDCDCNQEAGGCPSNYLLRAQVGGLMRRFDLHFYLYPTIPGLLVCGSLVSQWALAASRLVGYPNLLVLGPFVESCG